MMLKMPRFVRSTDKSDKKSNENRTTRSDDIQNQFINSIDSNDIKQTLKDVLLTPFTSLKGRKMVETYTMLDESESG